MKKITGLFLGLSLAFALNANASLVELGPGGFTPAASVITFSEYSLGTENPFYDFGTYNVSFGGYFVGGLGSPSVGSNIALDTNAPVTFISQDGANPTSPVLSGTPLFDGPVGVLFSQNVAAVGLDGGYFDTIGATTIEAYDRSGNMLGSVLNSVMGIEFFGLGDATGNATIAAIQFYITGDEPAGYAIDNLTFAFDIDGYNVTTPVPEPSTFVLLGAGLAALAFFARRKKSS